MFVKRRILNDTVFSVITMWQGHHNNGNVPHGMWSAPGHNPMMESQWTNHYQQMPQNQVSCFKKESNQILLQQLDTFP